MRETKTHYKMYKSGRSWVFAAVTVVTIGVGGLLGSQVTALADTEATSEVATDKTGQSTAGTISTQNGADDSNTVDGSGATDDSASNPSSDANNSDINANSGSSTDQSEIDSDATDNSAAEQQIDASSATKKTASEQPADTSNITAKTANVDAVASKAQSFQTENVAADYNSATQWTSTSKVSISDTAWTVGDNSLVISTTDDPYAYSSSTILVDNASQFNIDYTITNTSDESSLIQPDFLFPLYWIKSGIGYQTPALVSDDFDIPALIASQPGLNYTFSVVAGKYLPYDELLQKYPDFKPSQLLAIYIQKSAMLGNSTYTLSVPMTISNPEDVSLYSTDENSFETDIYNFYIPGGGISDSVLNFWLVKPDSLTESSKIIGQTFLNDQYHAYLDEADQAQMPDLDLSQILISHDGNWDPNVNYANSQFYTGDSWAVPTAAVQEAMSKLGYSVVLNTDGKINDYLFYSKQNGSLVVSPDGTIKGNTDPNLPGGDIYVGLMQVLKGHDSTLSMNDTTTWQTSDNFDEIVEQNDAYANAGNGTYVVDYTKLTAAVTDPDGVVTENADGTYTINHAGTFTVTYSYPISDSVTVSKTQTIVVTGRNVSTTIEYRDADQNDAVVQSVPLNGVTGESTDYTVIAPTNYELKAGTATSGTYNFVDGDNPSVIVYLTHRHSTAPLSADQEPTWTVQFAGLPADQTPATQTGKIGYTVDTDLVTGEKYYQANSDSVSVTIPQIDGYSTDVSGDTYTIPTVSGDALMPDVTKTITYTAGSHSINLSYIDDVTGKQVDTSVVSGDTDQSVVWVATIPAGYELATGQAGTGSYTFKAADNADIVVHLTHQVKTTTQTTTRTVHYYLEGTTTDIRPATVQTVKWVVKTDAVTGESCATAQGAYAAVSAPEIDGYKAVGSDVDALYPAPTATDKLADTSAVIAYGTVTPTTPDNGGTDIGSTDTGNNGSTGTQTGTGSDTTTQPDNQATGQTGTDGTGKVTTDTNDDTVSGSSSTGVLTTQNSPVEKSSAQANVTASAKKLPQTDESETQAGAVAGLGILSLLSVFRLAKRRKHEA